MGFYQRQVQPRLLTFSLSRKPLGQIRSRVCDALVGDILEIGYGSGLNQPHLPRRVTSVTAVEPSSTALRLSAGRRAASPVPVVVGAQDARDLPFADDTFDAALSTWTLCGIADPGAALREVARVLRPGAALHFVEHGLAPDAVVARRQRRGSRVNQRFAGCVLDHDVRSTVENSGLTLGSLRTYYQVGVPKSAGYFYEGHAVA